MIVPKHITRINKCENDLAESIEMLKASDSDPDMKDMFTKDIERLNGTLILLRIEIIQLLINNEPEDKENAYVEISAGVGGLESRIFCSELYEMYRLYSDHKNWTFRPLKVYTDMTGIIINFELVSRVYPTSLSTPPLFSLILRYFFVLNPFKEIGEMMRQAKLEISGVNVFKHLKFESGVHRVQVSC